MEAKHAQIHRFVEILADLLSASPLRERGELSAVDMGAGKGYLTFALYDYLYRVRGARARVSGVEAREELVALCNRVAREVGFGGLSFRRGSVLTEALGRVDLVVALHACDTATDEALYRGIRAGASLIVCAPCCHKELRPQMRCRVDGLDAVLKSGILLERQAELVTDGVRALLCEAMGYRTRVFEFVAAEHTSKNLMIAAVKRAGPARAAEARARVAALKRAFGFGRQRLEELLFGGV
jgi:SAM-dependent methyltransferase